MYKTQEEVNKEFEQLVWGISPSDSLKYKKGEEVKNFIHTLRLQDRLDTIKEIEKLKRSHMDDPDYPHDDCMHCVEYNQAIKDIKTLLEQMK